MDEKLPYWLQRYGYEECLLYLKIERGLNIIREILWHPSHFREKEQRIVFHIQGAYQLIMVIPTLMKSFPGDYIGFLYV